MTASEKKTDVWMPLWIGAYLADTMAFTTEQHGAYLLLILAYWRERAPLLDNDDTLRGITKMDRADWKRMRPVLARKFRVADGVWWHKRVEQEMSAADARSKKATEKASKAAQARWQAQPEQTPSNATSMHQALHKDVLEECPPPSPIPSSPTSKKKRGDTPLKPPAAPWAPPDWVPAVEWGQFEEHRKAMRGVPFTNAARDGVVRELAKLRDAGHDPAELLSTAVTRGWRQVFAPKAVSSPPAADTTPAWKRDRAHASAVMTGGLLGKFKHEPEIVDVEAQRVG